ncbi:C-C chemokine receptor type 6 [Ambystoma mexicanum]|uniref:C-C chemokine receptor type 6 n=1 Tax=Ambystoma mexicanum TaxID=8296 RepID=UPI0037E9C9AB
MSGAIFGLWTEANTLEAKMGFSPTPHATTSDAVTEITIWSEYDIDTDTNLVYDSDATPCDQQKVRDFAKQLVSTVYPFICILGLVGNIFVVLTFTFYKRAKSMTDIYLLNMAIADILFGLTIPFWTVYHADSWIFGDFMCKLVQGVYKINFNCSMLLLACISIDRYIAIVQATRSFRFRAMTLTHKGTICLFVWMFSVVVSSVTYAFNQAYEHNNSNGPRCVCEPNYEGQDARTWKTVSLAVQVLLGFFLPFLIMFFCYAFIVRTLLRAHNFQRHKAIRVVIAVVVVFLICQIPYNLVILLSLIKLSRANDQCAFKKQMAYAKVVTETLAFFHCCLNPVLYAFLGVNFRNYFLKIMQDIWCLGKKYVTGPRSSRVSSDACVSRKTSEVYDERHISSFTM